jgi:5-(carboxyamino)imidazole ribonucleotide synthase
MINLVGEEGYSGKVLYQGIEKVLALPNVYIHLYGKKETKPGRKMGHINVIADSREQLMSDLIAIKKLIKVIAQ